MSIIEITNRDYLQVGDVATFTYNGHEFTGVVWSQVGRPMIGKTPLGDSEEWDPDLVFVRATREMPPLPTEPGSVIYVTEVRGKTVHGGTNPAMCADGGDWMLTYAADGDGVLAPSEITGWRPAKVVPA